MESASMCKENVVSRDKRDLKQEFALKKKEKKSLLGYSSQPAEREQKELHVQYFCLQATLIHRTSIWQKKGTDAI